MRRTVTIPDANAAKALFGPLHRHVALIHDAFRRGESYLVDIRVAGNEVALESDNEPELARAEGIFLTLIRHFDMKKRLREGDVRAAISFSTPGEGGVVTLSDLPTLGSFTLQTPRQQRYVEAIRSESKPLVFGVGPAGTGKTFLAVTAAVEALRNGLVDRIVVTRPAVEAGERLGFLPGALEEKVDPYLQPIWDAFRSQMRDDELKARREQNKIEVAPIAFMRGRTLSNAFVIVDEAQNATIQQMKMVLTRLGQGSQMVVTGDPSQIDLASATLSGLDHALHLLGALKRVEVVRFTSQDVMRHDLVAEIVEAYDHDEKRRRHPS
ncbi:MAG: PhoH family protein [Hyphomonadaceae bacterium]|nr:PhoH family protein [Hyphomonadaceae bacterium]